MCSPFVTTPASTARGELAARSPGAIGVWLGARPTLWRAVEPTADFARSIPPVLVYPLMLLGFGYNEESRITTVAFGALGMVLLPVASALSRVPAARADVGGAAGTSPPRGAALAHHRRAVRATAFRVRALAALQEYRPEPLWLVILLAGALNAALSSTLIAIERRLVHWQPE